MTPIRVALVEDSPVITELLQSILLRAEEFLMEQLYTNAEDAIRFLPHQPADIVLMDIHLPGMNGIEAVAKLKVMCPHTQFMMCTISAGDEHVFEALRAGAAGYLLKDFSPGELLTALHELHHGGSPMSASIARKLVLHFQQLPAQPVLDNQVSLTAREEELLQLLSEGLRYKDIADRLFVSVDTVKKHCFNIYRKLHVRSRTEAVNKVFHKTGNTSAKVDE